MLSRTCALFFPHFVDKEMASEQAALWTLPRRGIKVSVHSMIFRWSILYEKQPLLFVQLDCYFLWNLLSPTNPSRGNNCILKALEFTSDFANPQVLRLTPFPWSFMKPDFGFHLLTWQDSPQDAFSYHIRPEKILFGFDAWLFCNTRSQRKPPRLHDLFESSPGHFRTSPLPSTLLQWHLSTPAYLPGSTWRIWSLAVGFILLLVIGGVEAGTTRNYAS